MAEALAVVGSAASVLQLVDFGLGLARERPTHFAALIGDIRRAMEIVRVYIAQHAPAPAAHPDLPAALTDGVRNLVERLHAVRKLLTTTPYTASGSSTAAGTGTVPSLSLARRVKWVLASKKFHEAFILLESQKTSLQLQLQQAASLEQKLSQSLQSFVDGFTQDQNTILDRLDNHGASLRDSFEGQAQLLCDRQDAFQSVLSGRVEDLEQQFEQGKERDMEMMGALEAMQAKVQASICRIRALQSLNSRLLERISNIETSDAAIDSEALAAIVRAEMQNVLLSLGGSLLPDRPVTDGPLAQFAQKISDQIGRDFLLSEESGRGADVTITTTKQPRDNASGRIGKRKTVIKVTFRPAAWLPLVAWKRLSSWRRATGVSTISSPA
ncbi:hypothetical protein B0T26DRAFT_676216 [Lasiosphaeria miniovina]|uniref:Uncharacterized protein n=1 Tax=Lasiosphaeria miniovina TaxID=1954250 RepID=A0AA40ALM3_9PEZI|nr:uncharacterized protein B0T26DRAFT_676216 [Lasiosphaeria miniovina]KAK0717987.1 hypothetical protein B0T26DRAFT_676216 [Lasiosphaeria miniovina]